MGTLNIGDKFGKLIIISEAEQINNHNYYVCKCTCCDKKIKIEESLLTSGTIISCNGYEQLLIDMMSNGLNQSQFKFKPGLGHLKNGMKFGKLTIVGAGRKKGNTYQYTCDCQCGKRIIVKEEELISGNIASCGHDLQKYKNEPLDLLYYLPKLEYNFKKKK